MTHVEELREAFREKFKISAVVMTKGIENFAPVYVRGLEARYEKLMEGLERLEKVTESIPRSKKETTKD